MKEMSMKEICAHFFVANSKGKCYNKLVDLYEKFAERMGFMSDILTKILTYVFVIIVYAFIYTIIRMIFLDIRTMSRKKNISSAEGYLKLMNLRTEVEFPVKESYELEKDNFIGRGHKCNIRIADEALSSVHCRIYKAEGTFFIEDVGSANGTLLNGEELCDEVVELIDGDKISVGTLMFLFVKPQM